MLKVLAGLEGAVLGQIAATLDDRGVKPPGRRPAATPAAGAAPSEISPPTTPVSLSSAAVTARPGMPDLTVTKVDVVHHTGLFGGGGVIVYPYVTNHSTVQVVAPIRIRIKMGETYDCILHGGLGEREERRVPEPCATLPEKLIWPSLDMLFGVKVDAENDIPESDEKNNVCMVTFHPGLEEIETFACRLMPEGR